MERRTSYEIITERILQLLEKGVVPWHRPWTAAERPRNLASGHLYRGINSFLLHAANYDSPYWLTFRQATERSGHVKYGEKGWPVIFWKWIESDKQGKGDNDKKRWVPLVRHYTVFNAAQCADIDVPVPARSTHDHEPIAAAERIVDGMPQPPAIRHLENTAFYNPREDVVNMPKPESFPRREEYYSTLFHELTHATGHKSRLDRFGYEQHPAFRSKEYGEEELVAEMGASFLCGEAGIVDKTLENSAAYLDGWIRTIRSSYKLVVISGARAQRAADYVLGQLDESGAPRYTDSARADSDVKETR